MFDKRRVIGMVAAAIALAVTAEIAIFVTYRSAPVPRFVSPSPPVTRQYIPPKAWLNENLSAADRNREWTGIVPMKPGDQIWSFSSPAESWRQEMCAAGECLVRNGEPVDGYAMLVN